MQKEWFSFYDFEAARWSFPKHLTEHEAHNELLMLKFRTPMGVRHPVLARWRPVVGWEYRPQFVGPYVALN